MNTTVKLDHCAADVVRQLLIDLEVATYPAPTRLNEWPCYVSKEPELPHSCITLYDDEGVLEGRFSHSGEYQEFFGVGIRIRSPHYTLPYSSDPIGGYNKALQIRNALNTQVNQTSVTVAEEVGVNSTVYLVHAADQVGTINSLGQSRDNSELYLFTLNYLFTITKGAS